MPCNFSAQCNQCNFGSSMARYMRKHMMMMHSRVKRPQGGDSLTNRLEVKPPVALCTMHHSGMHQSMHYVVWRQESRLGEMGIGGGRRHKNASPPPPTPHPWNNAISKLQCSSEIICSAVAVRLSALMTGRLVHCRILQRNALQSREMHCSAEKYTLQSREMQHILV